MSIDKLNSEQLQAHLLNNFAHDLWHATDCLLRLSWNEKKSLDVYVDPTVKAAHQLVYAIAKEYVTVYEKHKKAEAEQ